MSLQTDIAMLIADLVEAQEAIQRVRDTCAAIYSVGVCTEAADAILAALDGDA